MILSAVMTPEHGSPCAWRLHSRRLDREVWIVRDADALRELDDEQARGGVPVVLADDLERLRDLDDASMHAVLDTCAAWPGCRVMDALPGEPS